ncbi:Ankyrin repeat-containing domain [Phytophthora cactorum]|nr:Ankyrin repeat-containing domain [Phytophthora cactorum]
MNGEQTGLLLSWMLLDCGSGCPDVSADGWCLPNVINFEGRTALHLTVNRQLLAVDANVELGYANGQTPHMLVVKHGSVEITKHLIRIPLALSTRKGQFAGIVVYNGQLEIDLLLLLLEQVVPQPVPCWQLKIVYLLLECNVKITGATTPLMLAAAKGNHHIFTTQRSLSKWDYVERSYRSYSTPLTFAAESGQVEAARASLDHGAHVNSHGVDSARHTEVMCT